MAKGKDDFEFDDDYESEDWGDLFGDEPEPREPPKNKREAVDYMAKDFTAGVKDGFSKANLTQNLKTLTKNLAPKSLSDEAKQIGEVKGLLTEEANKLLGDNKDKLNRLASYVASKTSDGGMLNRLAKGLKDKTEESAAYVESIEEIAKTTVSGLLSNAEAESEREELRVISSYRQEEATNRIYNTLLKQEAFSKSITSLYYRKSLEFQYIHLTTAKQQLDVTKAGFSKLDNALAYVVKNTGLPDVVKMKSTEAVIAQTRNTLVDSKVTKMFQPGGLVDKLKLKLRSASDKASGAISAADEAVDGMVMADEMGEMMGSKSKIAGNSSVGMLMGLIGRQTSKMVGNTRFGRKIVDNIKGISADPTNALRDAANNIGGSKNVYINAMKRKASSGLGSLADLMDDSDGHRNIQGLTSANLSDAAMMNKQSLITQNEVIPGLLSKILKEVTLIRTKKSESEVEETKFDFETRQFSTASKQATRLSGRMSSVLSGSGIGSGLAGLAKFILNASKIPYSPTEVSEVKVGLTTFMLAGGTFNPNRLDDTFYNNFNGKTRKMVSMGINNLVGEKNAEKGGNAGILKKAFNTARASIPKIDDVVNRQIEIGNTDLLVKNNVLTTDIKTGKQSINEKEYNKRIIDSVRSYQGEGTELSEYKFEREDTIFDSFTKKKKDFTAFRGRAAFNANNADINLRGGSNRPSANSMFTINKSGTNSLAEKMATDAYSKMSSAKGKFNKNAYVVKAKKEAIEAKDKMTKSIKSSKYYKEVVKYLPTDYKLEFNVDTMKDLKTYSKAIQKARRMAGTASNEVEHTARVALLDILLKQGQISPLDYGLQLQRIDKKYTANKNSIDNIDVDKHVLSKDNLTNLKDGISADASQMYKFAKAKGKEGFDNITSGINKDNLASFRDSITDTASGMYTTIKGEGLSRFKSLRTRGSKAYNESMANGIGSKLRAQYINAKGFAKDAKFSDLENSVNGAINSVKNLTPKKALNIMKANTEKILSKLDLPKIKNLTLEDNVVINTILDSTKDTTELRANVLAYLTKKQKIGMSTLTSIMNSDKLKAIDDVKENTKGIFATIKGSMASKRDDLIGKFKNSKMSAMFDTKAQIEIIKDAVAEVNEPTNKKEENKEFLVDLDSMQKASEDREDERISTIISRVLSQLTGGSKKTKSNDRDGDGNRDGGWMSKWLNRKPKEEKSKDNKGSDKKEEKSKSPIWKILGVLGMGLPLIGKYIFGVVKGVGAFIRLTKWLGGGIWKVVKGLWSLGKTVGGLLGKVIKGVFGLGGKIVRGVGKGIKGLASRIWSLGTRIVTGMGGFIKGLGKKILGLGKTIISGIGGAIKGLLGGGAVDAIKNIGGKVAGGFKAITGGASSALSSVVQAGSKIGVKSIAKTAAKFLPGAGLAAGAYFAADELKKGNFAGAGFEAASGLATLIPFLGGPLSMGIDFLKTKYEDRNPKVDQDLYNNASFSNIDMNAADAITLRHIRKEETGSEDGKYDTAGDIGDGAGISFGAYQFTEKSGNLKKFIERIVALTNDSTGAGILANFDGNMYNGNKTGLTRYLKEVGATKAGKHVQDEMFKEIFLDPAKKLAASYNVTDPAAISQVIDHSLNAGLGGAKRMLSKTNGNVTPQGIAIARKVDYQDLVNKNSKLGKYMNTWSRRVDNNAKAFLGADTNITVVDNKPEIDEALKAVGVDPNVAVPESEVVKTAVEQGKQNTTATPPSAPQTAGTEALPNANSKNTEHSTYSANGSSGGTSTQAQSPVLNTTALEVIMKESIKHLAAINVNTAQTYARNIAMLSELTAIKTALGANSNMANKTNNNAPIKTSMPNSVDIKKGASVS